MLSYIGVFIAMFFTDVLFAMYVRRTSQGKALQAASFGALIFVFAGFVVVGYVSNLWLLIPAALGSFVGTYTVVTYDTRKEK